MKRSISRKWAVVVWIAAILVVVAFFRDLGWMAVVLVLLCLPAGALLRRDPPPPRGHCQSCAYNLTGNVSGVCPECGERRAEAEP